MKIYWSRDRNRVLVVEQDDGTPVATIDVHGLDQWRVPHLLECVAQCVPPTNFGTTEASEKLTSMLPGLKKETT